jgi:hypothetical protein
MTKVSKLARHELFLYIGLKTYLKTALWFLKVCTSICQHQPNLYYLRDLRTKANQNHTGRWVITLSKRVGRLRIRC